MDTYPVDVSVCMLTYYHEKYIKQAIESVLAQVTDYSYEIVISDDMSLDGTVPILREYQDRYPNIIRVYENKVNKGIPANIFSARCHCRGKYIVGLSGDDYWIDKFKIQKQCDFLEQHNEYFAVCCSVAVRYDDDVENYKVLPSRDETNKEFTINDYENGGVLNLHGFMMRNDFLSKEYRDYFRQAQYISKTVDDSVDTILFLKHGRIFVLSDPMNVYRISRDLSDKHNYNATFNRIQIFSNAIELLNSLDRCFGNEISFRKKYENTVSVAMLRAIRDNNIKEYKSIYNSIPSRYREPLYKSIFWNSLAGAFKIILLKIMKRFH